jgi:hypothetical protein
MCSQARGDSFTILLVLLLFGIPASVFLCNFCSKFATLWRGEDGAHNHSVSGGQSMGSNDSMGNANGALFTFPSLESLPKSVLDRYIAALEAQMKTARQRHAMLLNDAGAGTGQRMIGGNSGRPTEKHNSRGNHSANHSDLRQRKGAPEAHASPEAYRVPNEEEGIEISRSSRGRTGGWTNPGTGTNTPKEAPGFQGTANAAAMRLGGRPTSVSKDATLASSQSHAIAAAKGVKLSSRAAKGVLELSPDSVEMVAPPAAQAQAHAASLAAHHAQVAQRPRTASTSVRPVVVHFDGQQEVAAAPAGEASPPVPSPSGVDNQQDIPWMDPIDANQQLADEIGEADADEGGMEIQPSESPILGLSAAEQALADELGDI